MVNINDPDIEELFRNLHAQVNETAPPTVGESSTSVTQDEDTPSAQQSEVNTREELLALVESGKIKYSEKYIKKASLNTLERIKRDYKRKHLDATNEFITKNLVSKFSSILNSINMVDDSDSLEKELMDNGLLTIEIKNLVGQITPYIPLVGLFCGALIVGKHVISKKFTGDPKQDDDNVTTSEDVPM